MHTGEAAYYEQLRTVINELESAGAAVFYESAGPAMKSKAEKEWAAANDEERAAWAGEARVQSELPAVARRSLGWVDQWTTLGTPPTWRYLERSSLDYVRRAGAQNLMQRQRAVGEPFRRLTQEQQDAYACAVGSFSARLDQFAWWPHLYRLLQRLVDDAAASPTRTDDALVGDRNRQVLASLPTDSDAVLPWGAAHLPGLAAGLRNAGYRRRDTTWVSVGMLPTIWQTVKAFWVGVRALWTALDARDEDTPPPDTAA